MPRNDIEREIILTEQTKKQKIDKKRGKMANPFKYHVSRATIVVE